MTDKFFFLPFFGDNATVQVSVNVVSTEPFKAVLVRALRELARADSSVIDSAFDVSTASADIPLDPGDYDLQVGEIQKKYGNSFSIRLGKAFKIG